MDIIMILALLATVAAVVLAYIFIIPEKKRASLNKLGKFVHDLLNFKFLIVEKLIQFFYVLATAFVICLGFFMLFYIQSYWGYTQWYGGYGLLLMIVGPIVIRLSYELIMMAILVVKNVIQINNKLKNQNEGKNTDPFSDDAAKEYEFKIPKKERREPVYSAPSYYAPAPEAAPQPEPAPEPAWQPEPQPEPVVRNYFCSECGSRLNSAGICPNCGK